jgi:hypothetical protein
MGGKGCCSLRGVVSRPRRPASPLCGIVFLDLFNSFGIGLVGLLSQKKDNKQQTKNKKKQKKL